MAETNYQQDKDVITDIIMKNEVYEVTFKPLGAKRRKTLLGLLERQGQGKDGNKYYLFKRLTPEGEVYINDRDRAEHFLVRETEVTSITPEENVKAIWRYTLNTFQKLM